ncbi:MAG: hypothetical protein WC882_06050 [Candidatus Gracilibacteria bacterium]
MAAEVETVTPETIASEMRSLLAAVGTDATEVVVSREKLEEWLKVVGKLSSVCEAEPSPGPEAEATGPDQLSKACLLELLDAPDICLPYPGFRESWEGHKARLKGEVEKPDANLRVLALDLLEILNIFALQGFMEPEGVNAKQKAIALALLIQGGAEVSGPVKAAGSQFLANMQHCAEGRCSNQGQIDRFLPPVNPAYREKGVLIKDVLFVCVGGIVNETWLKNIFF